MAYRKFGRDSSARKAMLRSVVNALLEKERIETTEAKAKEVGGLADQMITLAKRGDLHARRLPARQLRGGPCGKMVEMHALHGAFRRIAIVTPEARGEAWPERAAAGGDDAQHRKRPCEQRPLRHIGAQGAPPVRIGAIGSITDKTDFAFGAHQPAQCAQQGGFARAVRPHDADQLAGTQADRQAVDDIAARKPDGNFTRLDPRARSMISRHWSLPFA